MMVVVVRIKSLSENLLEMVLKTAEAVGRFVVL